jgi:hypothetical protein
LADVRIPNHLSSNVLFSHLPPLCSSFAGIRCTDLRDALRGCKMWLPLGASATASSAASLPAPRPTNGNFYQAMRASRAHPPVRCTFCPSPPLRACRPVAVLHRLAFQTFPTPFLPTICVYRDSNGRSCSPLQDAIDPPTLYRPLRNSTTVFLNSLRPFSETLTGIRYPVLDLMPKKPISGW